MSKDGLIQLHTGRMLPSTPTTEDLDFKLLALTEMVEKCLAELAEVKAAINLVQSGCEMNCNSDCKCGSDSGGQI